MLALGQDSQWVSGNLVTTEPSVALSPDLQEPSLQGRQGGWELPWPCLGSEWSSRPGRGFGAGCLVKGCSGYCGVGGKVESHQPAVKSAKSGTGSQRLPTTHATSQEARKVMEVTLCLGHLTKYAPCLPEGEILAQAFSTGAYQSFASLYGHFQLQPSTGWGVGEAGGQLV